jgi:hypothetical protein
MARHQSIFGVFDSTAPYGIHWTDLKPKSPIYLDRYDEIAGEHKVKSTVSLMLGETALTTIVVYTEEGSTKILEAILKLLEKRA